MKYTVWMTIGLVLSSIGTSFADNLAPNPGFELPANAPEGTSPQDWTTFSSKQTLSSISREVKHSGEQSLQIKAQKIPGAYQGTFIGLSIVEGKKYTFLIYAINNRADPLGGTAHCQLSIEWIDDGGKEIARTYSSLCTSSLSKMRWEMLSVRRIQAPKGAVQAKFGIHLSDGDKGGKGSIFLDDALIEEN